MHARRRPGIERDRARSWSGPGEIAVGVLLLIVWAMLWAFFLGGVVEPAARLQASAAEHPSLDVAPALPDAAAATR